MSHKNPVTRRKFLNSALLTAASVAASRATAAESVQEPPKAPTGLRIVVAGVPTKRLLQFSDFEYLGGFVVPGWSGGLETRFGRGLTHRYLGNDLRFFSTGHKTATSPANVRDGGVFEFGFPGVSLAEPFPSAPILQHWGDIYGNKMGQGTSEAGATILREKPRGLWWDEQTERLYWSYCSGGDDSYCGVPATATLGASQLNSTTRTSQAIGAWRIGPAPYKSVIRGCVAIPDWFAQAHTGGKRIATGFGGYFSMMATGGVSMGPSMWAIDPPTSPHMSAIDATALVSYHPPNMTAYGRPSRCQRNADYRTKYDNWQPRNGIGYWSWTDEIHQGCVWIDLPDSHGVLFFPILGQGLLWYANSNRRAESVHHWWMAYDPYDLAKVAHGQLARDLVVPAWYNRVDYPRVPYPTGQGWQSEWPNFFGLIQRVVGSTFDARTRTLFLMMMTKPWPLSEQTIFAYRVK